MTAVAPRLIPFYRPNIRTNVARWARVAVALLPLALLGAGVLLVHLVNMGNFPYYENDEGTYLSQAWAIVAEGRLAPYTYWYDHAPAGWLQIALWSVVTGGFFSFGSSVESGRVLMLVYQVLSALLVYHIARSISGSKLIGAFALVLFGFSALGIYLHRRVLLDNITTFWMLLSIALVVGKRPTLAHVWGSAAALGISVLSKEVTIFLIPAMGFLVWVRTHASQRWLATIGWLSIVGSLVSLYFVMAALKGELFPTGTALGGTNAHVSLLGTLEFQASRGRDGGLFQSGSAFWTAFQGWAQAEPLLVAGGTGLAIASLAWIRSRPMVAAVGMFTLSLWLFMARGGIVIGFYVIPLLPLLALNVALVIWAITDWISQGSGRLRRLRWSAAMLMRGTAIVGGVAVLTSSYFSPNLGFASRPLQLWQADEASAQRAALTWIREHVSPGSNLVIDNYAWLDLRESPRGPTYELAHYYWKVGADPEITVGAYENDWRSADYIMVTPQVIGDAGDPSLTLVGEILDHSTRIRSFDGWPISIRRVDKAQRVAATSDAMVGSLWDMGGGEWARDGRLSSAAGPVGESALLQAVYMNDRASFDRLLAALGDPKPADLTSRAFALLTAGRRWNDAALTGAGTEVARDVWTTQTAAVGAGRVVAADRHGDAVTVALGSLAPEAYRVFAEADTTHDWESVLDGTYRLLARVSSRPSHKGQAGVIPDEVVVSASSGSITEWADESSAPGMRLAWHLTLDWVWTGDSRARAALQQIDVPVAAYAEHGRIVDRYGLDGAPHSDREAIDVYAASLGTLLVGPDPEAAHRILAQKILEPVLADGSDATPADIAWAWNATALLDGGMASLWSGQTVIDWSSALVAGTQSAASR